MMDHDNPTMGGPFARIPHYYGDVVRILFLVTAGVLLVALPAYPDLLPLLPTWQAVLAVVLVIFAALTNPLKRWALVADSVIAGILVIVIELIAIESYSSDTLFLFVLREAPNGGPTPTPTATPTSTPTSTPTPTATAIVTPTPRVYLPILQR